MPVFIRRILFCQHTSWKGKTLVYAHDARFNAHAYNVSKENEIKEDDKCIPISTDPSNTCTVKEFTERSMQHYKDHAQVKIHPHPYITYKTKT